MPIDDELVKVQKWGDAGDRTDPDDATLMPALVRANGWPATFSADSGDTPRRRVMNQIMREITGGLVDIRDKGILPWDIRVDYDQYAVVQAGVNAWVASVATGPATGNATNPTTGGQNVWTQLNTARTSAVPSAPNAPTGSVSNGEIEWSWNCPLDNGSAVIGFDFQWRIQGGAYSAATRVSPPHTPISGLNNGQTYQARVRAVNGEGNGPWSGVGNAIPTADSPDRVQQFIANPTDGGIRVQWSTPEDNGEAISTYHIQWRSGGQNWSSARQISDPASPATITNLNNGTAYEVRIRAVNSEGSSDWSNPITGITPSEGEQLYTAPGNYQFVWPWSATKARVVSVGGGGGGGGSSGANLDGNRGQTGDDSSASHQAMTVTGNGGRGGIGGSRLGLAGNRVNGAIGNGGAGGFTASQNGRGEAGMPGAADVQEISGLDAGDIINVIVGNGGPGGVGGDGFQANDGDPGGPGSVTIVPVY